MIGILLCNNLTCSFIFRMSDIKKLLKFYIEYLVYWIGVGIFARGLFFVFYYKEFDHASVGDIFSCFRYGLSLDISVASYIVSLGLVIGTIYVVSRSKGVLIAFSLVHYLILVIYFLITIADIAVFRHWNTKVNLTAIQFADHPKEVWASIGDGDQPLLWILAFISSMGIFIWIYRKILKQLQPLKNKSPRSIAMIIVLVVSLLGMSFVGIRGGFQLEPINQSIAYFSDQPIQNQMAINATWNLIEKISSYSGNRNPYHFGSVTEVNQAVQRYYQRFPTDTINKSLSTIPTPNLVFIIVEGLTADVIAAFGGETGLTPTLDSLVKTGMIWTHFYANGDRTFKGLPAILSGQPARAMGSIIMDPDQTTHLPSLPRILKAHGYSSSFYYGGESEFANIKSYLLNTGFEKIVDIKDFPASYRGKKWGVPDHYVFERLNEDLSHTSSPFFTCLLTLSTHEPYDIPVASLIPSSTWPDLFRNTVYYFDQSLGKFIQQAKLHSWYDSTLFILTADHGNLMPKDYQDTYDPGKFKIPLLIFGKPLAPQWSGKISKRYGTQNDITYTILKSLAIEHGAFPYSFDLMNEAHQGNVFYTFDHGFGLINDHLQFVYDLNGNRTVIQNAGEQAIQNPKADKERKVNTAFINDSLIKLGKYLMQGTYSNEGVNPLK